MFDGSGLEFVEVETLRRAKAELLVRLESTTNLKTEDKEYLEICIGVLKDYKSAIEKFNKEIGHTINYIENIYKKNILGIDNRYLVEMQLHLEYIQMDENKAFEAVEDKTWRMEKKSKDIMYMFDAKYALAKGLSKKNWV